MVHLQRTAVSLLVQSRVVYIGGRNRRNQSLVSVFLFTSAVDADQQRNR